jgi:Na+/H+ antiporter
MSSAHQFELILALVAIVLVLEMLAKKLRLPPSAALVLGGLALALIPGTPEFRLDPELTLLLFLPPLLVESAFFTAWRDFKANLRIILQLAVGAVIFTTLVVGVVTHWVVPSLPWAACFALGAIVSPPDAVAAKAVLKGLPLPPRITTLLEGESLVNDATGLVLFKFAVAAGLTGSFSAGSATLNFLGLAIGGAVLGTAFGYLVTWLLLRVRESHVTIVATFLAAWASYILGELLHVSGVLATVACGLMLGWRSHELASAETRIQARAVWSVVVFALESLVFVMIGLSLRGVLSRLSDNGVAIAAYIPAIAWITAAMILARFFWIFPAVYIPRLLFPRLRARDPYPPVAVPIVMSWAGMRGVVSLAVAWAVPEGFPGKDFILATTLVVILISILVQGSTLVPLIRALRLNTFVLRQRASLSEAQARVELARAAHAAVTRVSLAEDGTERHPRLVEQYGRRLEMATRYVETGEELAAHRDEHFAAVLLANRAARERLLNLYRSGDVHDSVLNTLEIELDLEELGASNLRARTTTVA